MVPLGEIQDKLLAKKLKKMLPNTVKWIRSLSGYKSLTFAKRLKLFAPTYDVNELCLAIWHSIGQFVASFPELYHTNEFKRLRNAITRRLFGAPTPKQVKKGKNIGTVARDVANNNIVGKFHDRRFEIYESLYKKVSQFGVDSSTAEMVKNLKNLVPIYKTYQKTHPPEVLVEVRGYLSKINPGYRFYEPIELNPDLAIKSDNKNIAVEIKEGDPELKVYTQVLGYFRCYDAVILATPTIPEAFSKQKIGRGELRNYFNCKRTDLENKIDRNAGTLHHIYDSLRSLTASGKLELNVLEECILITCAEAVYGNLPTLRYELLESEKILKNLTRMDFESLTTDKIGKGGKYKFVEIMLE